MVCVVYVSPLIANYPCIILLSMGIHMCTQTLPRVKGQALQKLRCDSKYGWHLEHRLLKKRRLVSYCDGMDRKLPNHTLHNCTLCIIIGDNFNARTHPDPSMQRA